MSLRGQLNRYVRRKAQSSARNAAVEIMNDLAKAGPNWTGEFANSWVADAPGVGAGPEGSFPYTIRDTPKLPDTVKAVSRSPKLVIRNTTEYALQALDIEEGEFVAIGDPVGKVVKEGKRVGKRRGEVQNSDEGNSRSTAELDWFPTYLNGGGVQKALGKGVKIAFAKEN